MRFAVGRMATVLLVVGSALYMLQVDDSTAAKPAPPPALGEFITNLGPTMAAVVVTRVTSDSSPAALQQRT